MGSNEKPNQWQLELNEVLYVSRDLTIRRVPGGWIYNTYQAKEMIVPTANGGSYTVFGEWEVKTSTFVPYKLQIEFNNRN